MTFLQETPKVSKFNLLKHKNTYVEIATYMFFVNLFSLLAPLAHLILIISKVEVVDKGWHFLRTYVLTLPRFDLCLQGSLLIVIMLETNIMLLLRRHNGGYTPAVVEDWVAISTNGAEFLLGSLLAWCGRHKRNLALSATLGAASLTSFLVLLTPFGFSSFPYVELCGGEPVLSRSADTVDANATARLSLLIIAAYCCTFAKVSIWAHGLTYLDDHAPENGPYFYGILICIRLSLGLSGQNWLQDASLSEEWWKAHVSLCSLTFMFACLFLLFPSQMKEFPGMNERQAYTGYFKSLGRLVRNKALVLQTLALALLTAGVFGFVNYDRFYVQAKFHIEAYRQDPQTSRGLSDIFRTLVIVFYIMIFRIRFSSRRVDGVKGSTAARVGGIVSIVVAALLTALAILYCDLGEVEGLDGSYQQPACSDHCGCDSTKYGFSPVCGVDDTQTTFFSPCHAGCGEYEVLNGFYISGNCSCVAGRAVRGACSITGCRFAFSVYQVIFTVMLAVAGSALLMQGMAVIRAVERIDKPQAVGWSFSMVALLAYVCGHLIYMLISHATCAYSANSTCIMHRPILWVMPAVSAVLALASAGVSLFASKVRKQQELTTEL